MIRAFFLLVALPYTLHAQQLAPRGLTGPDQAGVVAQRPVQSHLLARPTSRSAPSQHRPAHDSTSNRKLVRYTGTGMAVGAIAGVLGGTVGSRYAGCGCSDAEKTVGFALWFGALGAAAGAILGAAIGFARDHAP